MELAAEKIGAVTAKRSRWVTAAIILQALWALTLIGLSFYLLILTRGKPPDHADGLLLAAGLILAPGLLAAAGWYGLWRCKLWGWWLSLMCDSGIVAIMVYAMIDDAIDEMLDWRMVATTLATMIVPVLLLLPALRKAYRNRKPTAVSA